eukprot:3908182-Rhodomonas_salina.11
MRCTDPACGATRVKQPRHAWNAENDERSADVTFKYQNEFQGCPEKLVASYPPCYAFATPCPVLTRTFRSQVVTPLTERCYNAIAQAVTTRSRPPPLPPYARATPCPVLTLRIVLPATALRC